MQLYVPSDEFGLDFLAVEFQEQDIPCVLLVAPLPVFGLDLLLSWNRLVRIQAPQLLQLSNWLHFVAALAN